MAEYIKREDAMEIISRTSGDYASAFSEVGRLPSADVVEVVRCKFCKKSGITEFGKRYCKEPLGLYGAIPTSDDNFCSYGERK